MAGALNFDTWTELLRNDCAAQDKIREFDGLGDRVLRILYENGLDPTVEAIVKHGINGKPRQENLANHSDRSRVTSRKLRFSGN